MSDENGSWKTIWIARLSARLRRGESRSPSSRIAPESGACRPATQRASVVLPLPDSPTSPSVSPGRRLSETESTACSGPPGVGKVTLRSLDLERGRSVRSRAHQLIGVPAGGLALEIAARARRAGRAAVGATRQSPVASGQRGWNVQPLGSRVTSGSAPGIGCSDAIGSSRSTIASSRPSVYGWWGSASTPLGRPGLDEATGVHHRELLAELPDDREVVAHEDERELQPRAHLVDQVEHLRLHGHVERRRRLVAEQHGGLGRERHRDHDALAHAAGELMRVRARAAAGSGMPTSPSSSTARARARGARHAEHAPGHLGDLVADGLHGIERASADPGRPSPCARAARVARRAPSAAARRRRAARSRSRSRPSAASAPSARAATGSCPSPTRRRGRARRRPRRRTRCRRPRGSCPRGGRPGRRGRAPRGRGASLRPQHVCEAVADQRQAEAGQHDREARESSRAASASSGTPGRR